MVVTEEERKRIRQRSYELTKQGYSSEDARRIMEQEGLLTPLSHYPPEQRKRVLEARRKGKKEARIMFERKRQMEAIKRTGRQYFSQRRTSPFTIEPIQITPTMPTRKRKPKRIIKKRIKRKKRKVVGRGKKKTVRRKVRKKRRTTRKKKTRRRRPRRRIRSFNPLWGI